MYVGTYWRSVGKRELWTKLPLVTLSIILADIVVYYTMSRKECCWYGPGNSGAWYACLVAPFAHTSPKHLWQNVGMLGLLGVLFEATEGVWTTLLASYGGGVLGFALHGMAKRSRVRGTSGVVYAIMWSQVSLLALNWTEMKLRWIRLAVCTLLFAMELLVYFFARCARAPSLHERRGRGRVACGIGCLP